MVSKAKILFVEPFYGGSHKALIDNLTANLNDYQVITLPAKKMALASTLWCLNDS
jgi:hypothetical protein